MLILKKSYNIFNNLCCIKYKNKSSSLELKDSSGNKIYTKDGIIFDDEDTYFKYLRDNDLLCIICWNDIISKEIILLKCSHKFHNQCLIGWFNHNNNNHICPICKESCDELYK